MLTISQSYCCTVEPLLTDTLNNGHLQTTNTKRWSKAVRYMEVPLYSGFVILKPGLVYAHQALGIDNVLIKY